MRHAADRMSVRWYLGYDLNEPLPDHSSLIFLLLLVPLLALTWLLHLRSLARAQSILTC